MIGFILKVQKVHDEDLLVFILSKSYFIKAYRFYGVRHPIISQGFKIDFELENGGIFLPHLRNPLHLGYSWLFDREKLEIWQKFMKLLYEHLKDASELDEFYFDILEDCAIKFQKVNPKRVIIESYLKLLEFEGRLHKDLTCFLCDKKITNQISLARGFLPAHKECIHKKSFPIKLVKSLFKNKNSVDLNDDEVNEIYQIILEGI